MWSCPPQKVNRSKIDGLFFWVISFAKTNLEFVWKKTLKLQKSAFLWILWTLKSHAKVPKKCNIYIIFNAPTFPFSFCLSLWCAPALRALGRLSGKTSKNQLQLFSVDNVIKVKAAAANTPASASPYLLRTEIYKRRRRSGVRGSLVSGPECETAAIPARRRLPQISSAVVKSVSGDKNSRKQHELHLIKFSKIQKVYRKVFI